MRELIQNSGAENIKLVKYGAKEADSGKFCKMWVMIYIYTRSGEC